jgi:hypothetical protein
VPVTSTPRVESFALLLNMPSVSNTHYMRWTVLIQETCPGTIPKRVGNRVIRDPAPNLRGRLLRHRTLENYADSLSKETARCSTWRLYPIPVDMD